MLLLCVGAELSASVVIDLSRDGAIAAVRGSAHAVDGLLDGVAHHEAVHGGWPQLRDAVDAANGLRLDGAVEQRLDEQNVRRLDQIEPVCAPREGQQQRAHARLRLERAKRGFKPGLAADTAVNDAVVLKRLRKQREHLVPLREDEALVVVGQPEHRLHHRRHLGAKVALDRRPRRRAVHPLQRRHERERANALALGTDEAACVPS
mmetsp:Transcript_54447/g.118718  ORF Transcript_54447/g.118718 Transcript_54447/m.118718 type:complete len:206 (-) Transcript_54447:1027-1644(-)